jgi:hypothetical protein
MTLVQGDGLMHELTGGQQQKQVDCLHQCTRCAIVFRCDQIQHHQPSIRNLCGNPFYYGKCNTCTGTNATAELATSRHKIS